MFYSLFYPVIIVLIIWTIEIFQELSGFNLSDYGLFPRSIKGLRGIIFSPFLHSDYNHLINNSVPLLIMGASLFYFYRKIALRVLLLIVLIGGLWTWISARPSYHIGASGLVYGLFGFLLISGFLRKNKSLMSISFLVAFIYGSMVWGILPIDYKISWEGHLWGLLSGMAMAVYYRKEGPQAEKYQWEEDEDEDLEVLDFTSEGNEEKDESHSNTSKDQIDVIYHYKKSKDD